MAIEYVTINDSVTYYDCDVTGEPITEIFMREGNWIIGKKGYDCIPEVFRNPELIWKIVKSLNPGQNSYSNPRCGLLKIVCRGIYVLVSHEDKYYFLGTSDYYPSGYDPKRFYDLEECKEKVNKFCETHEADEFTIFRDGHIIATGKMKKVVAEGAMP